MPPQNQKQYETTPEQRRALQWADIPYVIIVILTLISLVSRLYLITK